MAQAAALLSVVLVKFEGENQDLQMRTKGCDFVAVCLNSGDAERPAALAASLLPKSASFVRRFRFQKFCAASIYLSFAGKNQGRSEVSSEEGNVVELIGAQRSIL